MKVVSYVRVTLDKSLEKWWCFSSFFFFVSRYLYFTELERGRYLRPLGEAEVLLGVELPLQLQQLLRGEGGAAPARLALARVVRRVFWVRLGLVTCGIKILSSRHVKLSSELIRSWSVAWSDQVSVINTLPRIVWRTVGLSVIRLLSL